MAEHVLNLRYMVLKPEETPGTAEELTNGDFDCVIMDPSVTPTYDVDDEGSKHANGTHVEDEVVFGIRSAQVSCSAKMRSYSDTVTDPNFKKLAYGLGLNSTGGYEDPWTSFQPGKAYDKQTVTIWIVDVERGANPRTTIYKLAGCMGTGSIGAEGVGRPWILNCTFTGKLVGVENTSDAPFTSLASDLLHPEKYINGTVSVTSGGTDQSQKVSSWSLDLGNDIQPVFDQSDETGIAYYGITARAPRMSLNPLNTGTDNGFGATGFDGLTRNDLGEIETPAIEIDGPTMTLSAPRAQLLSNAIGEREGLVAYDQSWKLLSTGPGSEVTFEVTLKNVDEVLNPVD